ncbi:MAG: hypothetical protein AB7D39_05170 [Pseudodesulfovibrio sp.]|uniref:hypothetical protein n=1 Tax=Pseudodesulfovibrio sp. TaxID=2035812 RepID=UPI003D0A2E9F
MSNILLVEPDYRSKFPPLGLMKISSWHKSIGDQVSFVRGCNNEMRDFHWNRVYISSLFTWELPRTVKTIKYYSKSVSSPEDIYVGGIGATLIPEFITDQVGCTLIEGQIEQPGMLGEDSPAIAEMIPDYEILKSVDYAYQPEDAYFLRITKGCIRKCKFCAVPTLEKEFGYLSDLKDQIQKTIELHGEKRHMVIMDNNVLAIKDILDRIADIRDLGFHRGAKVDRCQRTVDFNQGIDARIIAEKPELAEALGSIATKPIRLAFDHVDSKMERDYRKAIELLSEQGFTSYTNYLLYNFKDRPEDFFHRLNVNCELNDKLGIRITGFPMRYIPIMDIKRGHISKNWHWRYLRGIQCVLQATHGLVSPRTEFVKAAFGSTYEEFLEILSMPDRYIIYRRYFEDEGAQVWRKEFRKLSARQRNDFLHVLAKLNKDRKRSQTISGMKKYRELLEHYYPGGNTPSSDRPY